MAKKKRPTSRKQPLRPERPIDLPDRRVAEGAMHSIFAGLTGKAPANTPLERAQALIYQAAAQRDPRQRVRLAHEALAVCPDCADALVILAEHAATRREELRLYEQAVATAERALGPDVFQQARGHFWGVLETRPYMRARQGLANALWMAGRRDEAVTHLQEMLALNPNDNQGVRYVLAGFLLYLDRDGDLAALQARYPDDGAAAWAYDRALLAFRQQGDTIEARRLLKAARKVNRHVPDYLLGKKFPPAEQPGSYSPGDEREALFYLSAGLANWKGTAGAVAWLRANVPGARKPAATQPRGPLGFVKAWLLRHLPQRDDVWQADSRRLPNWIGIGGELVRPWVVLVTSRSDDHVLAHEIVDEKPTADFLWDTLVQAMQHPAAGEALRPQTLQVLAADEWEALRGHLEEVGVGLDVRTELDQWDVVFAGLCEQVGGPAEPGLLDIPGVTPVRAASFYEAAAQFFRQAPWKQVGYEAAIRVDCDRFRGPPRYAVLMGQSGLTIGLALYPSLENLQRLWAGGPGADDPALNAATAVTFGEEWNVPVADVEAARLHGWPVARADAYPAILRREADGSVAPPSADEVALMDACLRTVPDFVRRRRLGDSTSEEFTIPVAGEAVRVVLTWGPEAE